MAMCPRPQSHPERAAQRSREGRRGSWGGPPEIPVCPKIMCKSPSGVKRVDLLLNWLMCQPAHFSFRTRLPRPGELKLLARTPSPPSPHNSPLPAFADGFIFSRAFLHRAGPATRGGLAQLRPPAPSPALTARRHPSLGPPRLRGQLTHGAPVAAGRSGATAGSPLLDLQACHRPGPKARTPASSAAQQKTEGFPERRHRVTWAVGMNDADCSRRVVQTKVKAVCFSLPVVALPQHPETTSTCQPPTAICSAPQSLPSLTPTGLFKTQLKQHLLLEDFLHTAPSPTPAPCHTTNCPYSRVFC
uniref:uncharacterized protein LOC132664575 n=1 Tax=Panthera onca TaxID=9690 RepID=UPI0029554273|nr:uncharacterized protein LOC132664575 [Panthera onca]